VLARAGSASPRPRGRGIGAALAFCSALAVLALRAQESLPVWGGVVRGTVMDAEFDAPVPLATVRTTEGDWQAETGEDGRFRLIGVPPGTYALIVSKGGYAREVATQVIVTDGGLTDVQVRLRPELTDMDEFVVEDIELASAQSETGLLNLRETALTFQDSVGKDLMSKAGASDAAGALKLVVGASIADGKYATVRGLGDRYVGASMNGIRLPSSDPRKRAVHLDVFPSGTIESLSVSKTFTPDLPGDYTGGGVDIRTIGVPDGFFLKLSFSREVNARYSDKAGWTTYDGAGTGNWGRHNGARGIPDGAELLGTEDAPFESPSSSSHEHLVDAEHPHDDNYLAADRMAKSFNPVIGTTTRRMPGNSGASLSLGDRIPLGEETAFGFTLALTWGNKYKQVDSYENRRNWAPLDSPTDNEETAADRSTGSQELKWSLLGSMGIKVGDNHSVTVTGIRNRVATDSASIEIEDHEAAQANAVWYQKQAIQYTERSLDALQLRSDFKWPELFGERMGLEVSGYMAHNLAEQEEPDVRFFRNVVVYRGGDEWTHQPRPDGASGSDAELSTRIWRNTAEDNSQVGLDVAFPFQAKAADLHAALDPDPARDVWGLASGKLKLGVSRDYTKRDYRQTSYLYSFVTQAEPPKPASEPKRADFPPGRPGNTAYQAAYNAWLQSADYKNWQNAIADTVKDQEKTRHTTNDPESLWTDTFSDYLGVSSYQNSYLWNVAAKGNDINYLGDQSLRGGYLMLEYPVTQQLSVMYGGRAEFTDMHIDPTSDMELADPERAFVVPVKNEVGDEGAYYYTLAGVPKEEAIADINDSRWLRATGLTYEVLPGMKLRLNYGETIARPTFLEMAPVITYDYISGDTLVGNRDLVMSEIENYDLRFEWFFNDGDVAALSVFRKEILNPIEVESFGYLGTDYLLTVNYPEGEVEGMEFEIRKKLGFLPGLLRYLSVGANHTTMDSTVTLPKQMQESLAVYGLETDSRDMQGQPEFVTNYNVMWDHPNWRTSVGLFYNIRGDMLKSGAAVGDGGATADIYSKSLSSVNVSVSQGIGKSWKLTFQAKNLIDPKVEDVYRESDGTETLRKSYTEGKSYSISLGGSF
jgi:TonB-dependent receptor